MNIIYEGWPGTGLRLEDALDPKQSLDTGGTHGASGGMKLYVCGGKGLPAGQIELDPLDVARLASMCTQWLAWHHAGRRSKKD